MSIYSSSERDAVYSLHESGSVSVWRRKPILSVLATPAVVSRSVSLAGLSTGTKAISSERNLIISLDNSFETAGSDLILEIAYESRVCIFQCFFIFLYNSSTELNILLYLLDTLLLSSCNLNFLEERECTVCLEVVLIWVGGRQKNTISCFLCVSDHL